MFKERGEMAISIAVIETKIVPISVDPSQIHSHISFLDSTIIHQNKHTRT